MMSRNGKSPSRRSAVTGRKSSNGGFSLIEVLVAVTILSTGIALVLRAYSTSLRALSESREILVSSMLARDYLAEASISAMSGVVPSSGAGSCVEPNDDFQWSVGVTPMTYVPSADGQSGVMSTLSQVNVGIRRNVSEVVHSVTMYVVTNEKRADE